MIDWKRKLTSRKLWMAIIGFVTGLMLYLGRSQGEADQIASLILSAASILAYIVGEGLADSGHTSETYLIEKEETENHPPDFTE